MTPPISKRAALFEAPPAMIAQAWPWVRQMYARMCLARAPDPEHATNRLRALRLRNALTQVAENATPVPEESASERQFPVDLSGWRYGDVELPENWGAYHLVLEPKPGPPGVGGRWYPKEHKVVLYLGDMLRPSAAEEFRANEIEVESLLAHELTHMAQWLMRALRALPGLPGLPSRRRRRPKAYDVSGQPLGWSALPEGEAESWMEEHALREVEFQPRLRQEVDAFRRIAPKLRPEIRRMLLRAWLLPFDKAEPKELTSAWWRVVSLVGGRDFFERLYHSDPVKWRDAATKFIKSVEDVI